MKETNFIYVLKIGGASRPTFKRLFHFPCNLNSKVGK